MRVNLYLAGVVCLCVLKSSHAAINNQAQAQRLFSSAQNEVSLNRRNAINSLGSIDRAVLDTNEGERNRLNQVDGNRDNDFVDFDTAQVSSESITKVTSEADLDSTDDFNADGSFKRLKAGGNVLGRPGPSGAEGSRQVSSFNFLNIATKRSCVFDRANNARCDANTKFRTPSGHCNNLSKKTFGMSGTAFGRAKPPTYQDGVKAVRTRTHHTNQPLPDARAVSVAATTTAVVLDDLGFSNQIMQWGQFIAHDLTSIAEAQPGATCCPAQLAQQKFNTRNPTTAQINSARAEIKRLRGDVCIAIERPNDPTHKCMTQVRSATVPTADCSPSPRLQMNTATHFCDGSGIYGSSTRVMNSLRTMSGGKMKVQVISGKELPPKQDESCSSRCPFKAGDQRINTTPNLIVTHTLFLKKHNQIATQLARINSHWNDERLFQETRRIISAMVQNIHYNEWLQHLLDTKLNKYDLQRFTGSGHKNTYNRNTNPSLLNELAGAALRFGHSTVGGFFQCAAASRLVDNFNKPDIIYQDGIEGCLAGMARDRPWKTDKNFVEDMRDRLFGIPLDIVALNVNRGRDHGFNSYAQYRKHYGFPTITRWNDLDRSHDSAAKTMLQSIYRDPRDIELYIGGVTERKLPNGYIGPLFAEILGDGFKKLRNGDRFYFESSSAGFSVAQVNALRAYKYSNLICDVGGVTSTPRDAFRHVGRGNPALTCRGSPQLNLQLWDEDGGRCSWRVDSRSNCCNKRRTIKRTCIGGRSCRPGATGCPGAATVTESCQPSCSSNNLNCNSDPSCSPNDSCSWRTVKTGNCCSGRRTITRQCIGGSSCRPGRSGCPGSTTITQSCSCSRYDPTCNRGCGGSSDNCRWQTRSTGQCCNGRRVIRRSCVGGSSCRAGRGKCSGSSTLNQVCRPNCPFYNPNCECTSIRPTPRPCFGRRCFPDICRGGRCFIDRPFSRPRPRPDIDFDRDFEFARGRDAAIR